MATHLKVWWWDGKPNYGDALNSSIIAHVSGRPVRHVGIKRAELFSIGSVMRAVRKRSFASSDPVYVWGTGMMGPIKNDFVERVSFGLVRGPLTATTLLLDDLPHGDPGLLTGEALGISAKASKKYQIGVIPHWTQSDSSEIKQLLDTLPNARLIDMRSDDVHTTTLAIAECELVLSSSLHGLIVADGLGIPNLWIDSGRIGNTTPFKFFDYALSVGRSMARPLTLFDLINDGVPTPDINYFVNLPTVKQTIFNAFPSDLRA